ncbi:hypothetical protein ACFV1L_22265 [Kitasatospora sp. NPDC059646]|uniref:hypothetical protein n=1 Tax=Kitasatospora sp. NPDC059646 TaxID=3346893 RepID=UPI0036A2D53A
MTTAATTAQQYATAEQLVADLHIEGIAAHVVRRWGTVSVAIKHTVTPETATLYIEQPADDPTCVLWLLKNEADESLDWNDWTVPADEHRRRVRTVQRIREWFTVNEYTPERPADAPPEHYTREQITLTVETTLARLARDLDLTAHDKGCAEVALDSLLYLLDHPDAPMREVIAEQYGMEHPHDKPISYRNGRTS